MKSCLIIPDCHIPYHNRSALRLVMKVAKFYRPEVVIILGDWVDFYQVSAHLKDPSRMERFEDEVKEGNKLLRQLESYSYGERYYIMGNHEFRLDRYLMSNAPDLKPYINADILLALRRNHWTVVPYKEHVKVGPLYVTHDIGQAGIHSTRQALRAYQDNVVIGHNHRLDYHVQGNAHGHPHVGASFGWLGDTDCIDYMHRMKAKSQWSLGFGWGHIDTKRNYVYLTPIPIVESTCCVDGRQFTVPS